MKIQTYALAALMSLGGCSLATKSPIEAEKSVQIELPADYLAWQSQRKASLTAEKGWLSLIGLHWLTPGTFTIGSADNQQIRLQAGPAELGKIHFDAIKGIRFIPIAEGVLVDGTPANRSGELKADTGGATPTEVSIGSLSFFVIDRSGRMGLRVKDAMAPSRLNFKGLDYFAYDSALKITARYEAYDTPRLLDVGTIIGTIEPTPNPGRAHFQLYGKDYQFELLEGSDATHFFTIFGDQTNGRETYGMARFLTGEMDAANATVTIDFNSAYNPPCAFTEFATCPMPPAGNRIAAKVTAGEKKYLGQTD